MFQSACEIELLAVPRPLLSTVLDVALCLALVASTAALSDTNFAAAFETPSSTDCLTSGNAEIQIVCLSKSNDRTTCFSPFEERRCLEGTATDHSTICLPHGAGFPEASIRTRSRRRWQHRRQHLARTGRPQRH